MNPLRTGWLSPDMKFTVETIGNVGSKVNIGGHELVFDQPASVPGGQDRGPSPLDVMSASVAACAHYFAAAYLHARGISPAGLTVEVTAEKERVPLSRIGRLEIRAHAPAGLTERHIAGIERAIKSCPAYGTMLNPPAVLITVDGGEGGAADSVASVG